MNTTRDVNGEEEHHLNQILLADEVAYKDNFKKLVGRHLIQPTLQKTATIWGKKGPNLLIWAQNGQIKV